MHDAIWYRSDNVLERSRYGFAGLPAWLARQFGASLPLLGGPFEQGHCSRSAAAMLFTQTKNLSRYRGIAVADTMLAKLAGRVKVFVHRLAEHQQVERSLSGFISSRTAVHIQLRRVSKRPLRDNVSIRAKPDCCALSSLQYWASKARHIDLDHGYKDER